MLFCGFLLVSRYIDTMGLMNKSNEGITKEKNFENYSNQLFKFKFLIGHC